MAREKKVKPEETGARMAQGPGDDVARGVVFRSVTRDFQLGLDVIGGGGDVEAALSVLVRRGYDKRKARKVLEFVAARELTALDGAGHYLGWSV